MNGLVIASWAYCVGDYGLVACLTGLLLLGGVVWVVYSCLLGFICLLGCAMLNWLLRLVWLWLIVVLVLGAFGFAGTWCCGLR